MHSTDLFKITLCLTLLSIVSVQCQQQQQQQQIDPAYLRSYYEQIQQQGGRSAAPEATPIFEQGGSQFIPSQPSSFAPSAQQFRVKDSANEQIRAQQRIQDQQGQYVAPTVRQYLQNPQPQQLQYQIPYQQQAIQYNRPQVAPAAKQTLALSRRPPPSQQINYQTIQQGQSNKDEEEREEDYENSNPNYQFGFDVKDDEYTNYQNRKEVRDGNVIKGSYSVVDSDGFIRTVTYTADPKEGFKADVVREPTDIVVKVPTPAPENSLRSAPQSQYLQQPGQYRPLPRQQQQQQQQQLQQRSHPQQLQPQQHYQKQQESQQYQYE